MAVQYFRGLDTWNSNEATEAWEGGGNSVPAGRYKAMIVGVGVEDKIPKQHRMVTLRMLEAYDEENKHAVGMEINDIFALEGEKNPQNYFKGLYKTVAPWALAPQFMVVDPQTQGVRLPLDWLMGDPGQPGAIVNVTIIRRERPVTNKETGQTETREFSEVQRGYELVEPSSFSKRVLAQAGLNPLVPEVPAQHPAQQHLLPQALQQLAGADSGAGNGTSATPPPTGGAQPTGGLNPQA
jgi:hypothetical protein